MVAILGCSVTYYFVLFHFTENRVFASDVALALLAKRLTAKSLLIPNFLMAHSVDSQLF